MLLIYVANSSSPFEFKDLSNLPYLNDQVVGLMADGKILEDIRRTFKNIPMTDNIAVAWGKEFSQFIYTNLLMRTAIDNHAIDKLMKGE